MKPQSLFDCIEGVVRILSTGQGMPNYLAYHAKQAAEEAQGMYDLGHYASVIHQVGGTAFYNTSDALEIIQNAAREKAQRIQQGLPY